MDLENGSHTPQTFFHLGDKHEWDPERWKPTQPLPERDPETHVRVLIVGAGFAGLMAALECWRKGHQVIGILDRNEGPNYSGDLIIIQPSALEVMRHWPQMRQEIEDDIVEAGTYCYRHNGDLIYGPYTPDFNAPEYIAEREARPGGVRKIGSVQIRAKFYRTLLGQVARVGFKVDYGTRAKSYFEDEEAGIAGVSLTDGSVRTADVGMSSPTLKRNA